MSDSPHATIGCSFASDERAVAAMRAVAADGAAFGWRVGALDRDRAEKIAQAAGAVADLDPGDPLAGVAGLATGADAASGINGGAAIGGVAGAIAGLCASLTPVGAALPVEPGLRAIAATLLFFAVGIAVGGVLGGAFGRRPSTHAGFRLIDAMEAGELALVASVPPDRLDEVRRALEEAGAADVLDIKTTAS